MKWRKKQKLENEIIYFDNAASTYVYDEVIDYVNLINKDFYANSSSSHFLGISSYAKFKAHKETLCDILHIKPSSLIFTSGGAESNNFALKGIAFANYLKNSNIVISAYEHPTIRNTAKYLEKFGFEIRICPLKNDSNLDIDILKTMIDEKTILLSTAHVCSELGTLTDIQKISSLVKSINPRCYYHVDAVQSFGKFHINLSDLNNIDMMSFSSHKIHGPKGVGALYIKPKTNIDPFICGSVDAGLRAGTINLSGICGFTKASEIIYSNIEKKYEHTKKLNQYLIDNLTALDIELKINTPLESSPYIINIAFKDIKSEVLLNALSKRNICVSSGSACASKSKVSETLKAMNLSKDYIEGAIRLSFSDKNTIKEIDIFIQNLKELIPKLKLFVRR
ncbi:MAG TPA: cysteine desulfurase family protein [Clostridia bacterium]|nr:MAG: putative cysteine desulfurase NifS [Firmicutes bacterium ADurb.Bin146]HOD93670.1 cysteine desulfurase family protein [Clostridia bacterium]